MRGRNILDGMLHEIVHELHCRHRNGVILKINFEKAYDKGKWPFLFQTLQMKGFSPKWISWVESFVSGGLVEVWQSMSMMMSDIFFQTKKVLRQGDSLSPLLFNIDADMLAILIN